MPVDTCRFCATPLQHVLADLGASPLSNSYLRAEDMKGVERYYPLKVQVCSTCYLAQLGQFESPEQIFGDYAYFSSFSDSWLAHCKRYAQMIVPRLGLGPKSLVVELASNDGYLLQYIRDLGIPVQGVEPAANVAKVAEEKGIPSLVRFFGVEVAGEMKAGGQAADLIIGNNVLAHVPDLLDFVAGMALLLKPTGTITMEFPHLLQLMWNNQFDTIYHEHFSYFSLITVLRVFAHHGLRIYDVEELPTHGGSLRIYACHHDAAHPDRPAVAGLLATERDAGMEDMATYTAFDAHIRQVKYDLLTFLLQAKRDGKVVVGYGAPAKGNTLLNYCGISSDLIAYTVDRSPIKQGNWLPGTRIPIYAPEHISVTRPDYVLILPWNIEAEITAQMQHIRDWGGQFVVPIPSVRVIP